MRAVILSFLLVFGCAQLAFAQDEIIVTASRIRPAPVNVTGNPGIFIEKKGSFLLLEVTLENDSRELSVRLKEMNATIKNMIDAAKAEPDIKLSLVDQSVVRPLSLETFYAGIRRGNRPDTSLASLKVKTDIPANVKDSYKLIQKLAGFVDGIEEVGRTRIEHNDQAAVSVVNPYQYRDEVRNKIIDEVNATVKALGGNYRVLLSGLDGPVQWTRSGDLNLAFYMNYSYEIIPASLTNYSIVE